MRGQTSKRKSKNINSSLVKYIYERDDGMCIYCGNLATELDHVLPTKEGGMSIRSNLVCACRSCNQKKKNHLDDDFFWFTRAIFWLLQKGEDTSWMDKFQR